jgi:alanine racemase
MTYKKKADLKLNYRQTFAEIDLEALRHNLRTLRSQVPTGTFFCPMIKSFAYGHGDVEIAKAVYDEGERIVGVALIEEGIRLRNLGLIDLDIFIFGPFDYLGAKAVIEHNFTPVVSSMYQLNELIDALGATRKLSLKLHLKFNTGMNRLGFSYSEISEIKKKLQSHNKLKLTGLCSHLMSGEDLGCIDSETEKQILLFNKIVNEFKEYPQLQNHLLNSSGFLGSWALSKEDKKNELNIFGVRPGIALFGVSPKFKNEKINKYVLENLKLKPVMCLKSEVIQVHALSPGQVVSYGGTWTSKTKALVGIIPIGYADGYTRQHSNKGTIVVLGKKLPVIGTVCMDYTLVDLTKLLTEGIIKSSQEVIGQEVVLFGRSQTGDGLPVESVAEKIDTIAYELLTCIGKRVPRQYLKEHQ